MHTTPLRTSFVLCALTVLMLLMPTSQSSSGQLNSRAGGITLIARLESLSVAAALTEEGSSTRVPENAHSASVAVTTSWAVPSNLTTVRVVQDGLPLFSQAAGESNRPGSRTDLLHIQLPREKSSGMSPQRKAVTIVVQAL